METQVTYRGVETTPELDERLEKLQARVEEAVPGARMSKYVVEVSPRAHAIGLVVTLPNGRTWVRHAGGSDWERAFLEMERRLDRLAEEI